MCSELSARVEHLATTDGLHRTPLARVSIHRRTSPTSFGPHVLAPGFGIVLSGGKRFTQDGHAVDYRAGEWLVAPSPVSTMCAVTHASTTEPYIALMVQLDARLVAEAMSIYDTDTALSDAQNAIGALRQSQLDDTLGDVLFRLVRLLDAPEDARVVGPLVERELLHRLLQSDQRSAVQRMGFADRAVLRVLREIDARFASRLTIDALARSVHLSVSSLHHRFKAATATSPLQYLKNVRLREARRLMVEEQFDASSAAYAVGYVSPSQFSRDYRRVYTLPPRRDTARFSGTQ